MGIYYRQQVPKHRSRADTEQEFSIEIPDKDADAIHSGT